MATPVPLPTPVPTPTPVVDPAQVSFLHRSQFPDDFKFGTASSAFQIEGAVAEDGRLPSIWDTYSQERGIEGWADGVDHYHRIAEDVKIMKDIGLDTYRFSISWSRILPLGKGKVNPAGVSFYNKLIDELIANDIEPYVTLFHWDLPQALEDEYNGFRSKLIVPDFENYANVCFKEFGNRVKHWTTFNEPWSYSFGGYAVANLAPGRGYMPEATLGRSIQNLLPPSPYSIPRPGKQRTTPIGDPGTEPYQVTHYQLLAHAAAVKLYRRDYKEKDNGEIGITLVSLWTIPFSEKPEDVAAAVRAREFTFGWFMDPLTTGNYPESMRKFVGSRLPEFLPEESDSLIDSFDFLGLNYYTASWIKDAPDGGIEGGHYARDSLLEYHDEKDGELIGPPGGSTWLHVYPPGIRHLLTYIRDTYNNPKIYITENGIDEVNDPELSLWESIFDHQRVGYHHDHLLMIKKAIEEDKCKVLGYFAWSILDNFEWGLGFDSRFGITFVDFNNGFTRYPKLSSGWFNYLLRT